MPNETALNNVLLQSNANAGGYQITNSGGIALTSGDVLLAQNPTNALHAVTKQYADAIAGGAAADRGIVAGAGGLNFAQDSDYTANRIPFATGTTTMGFSADITWDDGLKSLAISGKIEQSGAANSNYFEGPIAAGTSSSVAGNAIYTGRQTLTNTTGTNYGHVVSTSFFPTSASTGTASSAYVTGNTTSATGDLSGASFNGMHINVGHSNTSQPLGTLRNIYSYAVHGPGAGAITNFHGADFYIDANAGAGKITDLYELRLRSYVPSSTVTGTQYAISQENGSALNSFAGSILGKSTSYFTTGSGSGDPYTYNPVQLGVYSSGSYTSTKAGLSVHHENATGSSSAGTHFGISTYSKYTGTGGLTSTGAVGILGMARSAATGTASVAAVIGVWASSGIDSSAVSGHSISNVYGVRSFVYNFKSGSTVTNSYGVYIEGSTATGTITNRYGLYQAGANDNNWFSGASHFNSLSSFGADAYAAGRLTTSPALYAYKATGTTTNWAAEIRHEGTLGSPGTASQYYGALFSKSEWVGTGQLAGGYHAGARIVGEFSGSIFHNGQTRGLISQTYLTASATAGAAYMIGLYVEGGNQNAGQTLGNYYGLYIAPSTATGTITNRRGIVQEGVDDTNVFKGPTIFQNTVTISGDFENDVARGELYQDDTGTTVTLTAANTWYQVAGTWTSPGLSKNITLTTAGGTMTPTQAGIYLVDWHLSGTNSSNNQTINAGIRKNGTTVVVASQAETTFAASGDTYGMSGMALVSLNGTTDYIRMAVNNNTSAGTTFTVDHARMTIIRVGNI
jgi:hypothetical protein